MRTFNDLYLWARHVLKDAGITAYNLEARFLIAEAAKKTPEELLRDFNFYADSDTEALAVSYIRRRAKGEPVAYIMKEWEFLGLPIRVNENVLIPRTDTEVLAEKAIELLKNCREGVRVLDLCCGSGCIGIAIAHNVPQCKVTMADKSMEALKVCRFNVGLNHVGRNVNSLEIDALEPPPKLMGKYDLIVSNPPYIPTDDIKNLDDSVKHYEPLMALDGGIDGYDFYRSIVGSWKDALKNNGVMMLEVGIGQAEIVKTFMRAVGFYNVCSVKDTGNIERVCIGVYKNKEEQKQFD